MKVLHIITGLNQGGAEGALYRLLLSTPPVVTHAVVSLLDDGRYGQRLQEHGIPVHTIGMPRGFVTLPGLMRLRAIIRAERPDVIQTWMYHADLLGGLLAKSVGRTPVIWGIRHSTLDPRFSKLSTKAVVWACARLSALVPDALVSCSHSAIGVHQRLGYKTSRMVVVANGFDTVAFQPNVQARESVRRNLNIGRNEIVVGCVARWDPQKDHRTLFSALSLLKARGQRLRCICAGSDMVDSNNELSRLIRRRGLQDDVLLLGPWSDVAGLMNALDVHVMSSAYGEAFPNVLAEAMACGIPCVTTDVGDARAIIGDTGWVVLPRDPAALADALSEAIAERGREDRRRRSRERVESQFTLGRMASGFVEVWTSALGGHS